MLLPALFNAWGRVFVVSLCFLSHPMSKQKPLENNGVLRTLDPRGFVFLFLCVVVESSTFIQGVRESITR
jgi:hypothetical protein